MGNDAGLVTYVRSSIMSMSPDTYNVARPRNTPLNMMSPLT